MWEFGVRSWPQGRLGRGSAFAGALSSGSWLEAPPVLPGPPLSRSSGEQQSEEEQEEGEGRHEKQEFDFARPAAVPSDRKAWPAAKPLLRRPTKLPALAAGAAGRGRGERRIRLYRHL